MGGDDERGEFVVSLVARTHERKDGHPRCQFFCRENIAANCGRLTIAKRALSVNSSRRGN